MTNSEETMTEAPQAASESSSLSTVLEGLLFAMGQETSVQRLVRITGAEKDAVVQGIDELAEYYKTTGRGLAVVRQDDKVQMVTSESVSQIVAKYQKEELEGPLSKAAMETLSIIAYKGPITKPEIDTIRGVNSGIMLRTLLVRGMIDRKRSKQDARTFSYALSMDFLRHLGLTSVDEIPGYKDFSENQILEKLAESVHVPEQHKDADSEADENHTGDMKTEGSDA